MDQVNKNYEINNNQNLIDIGNNLNDIINTSILRNMGEVIKVIGVGGGGCNAVDSMIKSGVKHVEFICANTDAKALYRNSATIKLQLGNDLTRGLGAGSKPEIGKKSALEDRAKIEEILKGADMLFIAAGMGGGTGTGAAPVIAEIARERGILTVGVVTKPFAYEGEKRKQIAELGINELKEHVDSLIVLPNEKLLSELDEDVSMREAFSASDNILKGAVLGITEVIKTPGVISLDFADIKTVMSGRGLAMMGSATSSGNNRASEAATNAILSPLLDDVSLDGARGVLVNISSAPGTLKMKEYHEILRLIQSYIDPAADFKAGMAEIEDLDEDTVRVTVIATGLSDYKNNQHNIFNANIQAEITINNENHQQSESVITNPSQNDEIISNNNFDKSIFSTPAFFRRNRN